MPRGALFIVLWSLVFVFRCLVFFDGFGKLIGAGRVAFATDACKKSRHFVDIFAFHKPRNTLQIAAATADKANVMHFVVRVHVE